MFANRTLRLKVLCAGAGLAAIAAAGLPGVANASPDDTGTIRNAGASGAIDNSYIVVMDGATSRSTANAQGVHTEASALAEEYGGKVKRTYSAALRGFSADMSESEAKRLAADPKVKYVSQNGVAHASETWGLDRIDQADLPLDDSYTAPNDGANATAYIVDTGVDMTHPDFEGRATSGKDFVDGDDDASDCQGHGTHVAGTVGSKTYGVAKKVNLVAVRVLDCEGSGSYENIIAGIDWVTQNAADAAVGNMSLGGSQNAALDDAVEKSTAAGVAWSVAAGNESSDACGSSPAAAPSAMTMAASDKEDNLAEFSNFGDCVDAIGPGVDITSTMNGGGTGEMSGTSMASPHGAGALAVERSGNPSESAEDAIAKVTSTASADKIADPAGSPNLLLNVTGLGGGSSADQN
ncbi:S8 family peptidase [Microlunatus soli]|uniref:Peptidase inhibitor I9 n=1 Tax=Microlunatus soli TaxID=630515 RepID=A0A1H1WFZ4_9ACTN|nr:S8 family peptidase [Microlunatus soli]SDS96318.1 Peptidase inhibitor I9 [Microlunatus soli]